MTHAWERLEEGLHVLRDSCLVYALRGPAGTVLVNAGTGQAAQRLAEVVPHGSAHGSGAVTVLLTHHFRDHSDGARALQAAGARIVAPYWEQEYFLDPEQHFRERQIWNSYDNRWDRFSPVAPIEVDEWAMDYGTVAAGGLTWTVVPTPGVTNGACSYVVEFGGRRLAFVGETICGHGRTGRLAPLQYNYNDLLGAQNLFYSATRVLAHGVDRMLPSLGEPIDDPAAAVGALRQNILEWRRITPGFPELRDIEVADEVEQVLPHLYRGRHSGAETHFLVADSGKVMCIDYGYAQTVQTVPGKSHPSNRRPLLHSMRGLQKHTGATSIDAVLVSHFHDDHVNGINLLRRLYGTQVWAADLFADLLEEPMRWDRPCLWHEPIPVDQRLPVHETFEWEGIPITLSPMSGHTRFATLISFEIDGQRVVHTGYQIFYDSGHWTPGSRMFTNHVYKNGLDLGCYHAVVDDLERIRPDWVLTGHTQPFQPTDEWYREIRRGAEAFDDLHRKLMILGDDEAHFGAESQGGKLKPYRVHLPGGGGTTTVGGWVLNPLPVAAEAVARLVVPGGWEGGEMTLSLGPRQQADIELRLTVPAGVTCRRVPVALDLTVDGRPFGQVAEALVTVGHARF
jgi:glyoxylase-like metal-dependent hydrolase (beta-lactamase superfamily II)